MTAAQRVELCMAVDEFTSSYAKLLALKIKVEDGECFKICNFFRQNWLKPVGMKSLLNWRVA